DRRVPDLFRLGPISRPGFVNLGFAVAVDLHKPVAALDKITRSVAEFALEKPSVLISFHSPLISLSPLPVEFLIRCAPLKSLSPSGFEGVGRLLVRLSRRSLDPTVITIFCVGRAFLLRF